MHNGIAWESFKNRAPHSASAADDMTCFMIVDVLRMTALSLSGLLSVPQVLQVDETINDMNVDI